MHTYSVAESKKITTSTLLLTLQRGEYERPLSFQPGQYAAISFERNGRKSVTRCFSMVSSPTDQDTLQFSMRARGRFTNAILGLQPGDAVNVSGPFGGFVMDTRKDVSAVFLAGGIGITPFMSMLRYMRALGASNNVTLFYSCATQDDIPFKDELLEINKELPNTQVIFVIGNGPTDKLPHANVATGFISMDLLKQVPVSPNFPAKYFICGPPGFMQAMLGNISKQGVPGNRIVTEAFTQSSPRQSSILRSWPANVYVLGTVGVLLAGLSVVVTDLRKALPVQSPDQPTQNAPYLVTNSRQQQLSQLVNSVPPSNTVITAPTKNKSTSTSTQQSTPTTSTLQPVYTTPTTAPAPAPTTSTSTAP